MSCNVSAFSRRVKVEASPALCQHNGAGVCRTRIDEYLYIGYGAAAMDATQDGIYARSSVSWRTSLLRDGCLY